MGQCQYCRRASLSTVESSPEKGRSFSLSGGLQPPESRHSGSDSALDSGHSFCDEGSCGDGQARSSHSSESSGKYSLRESLASNGDCERPPINAASEASSGTVLHAFHGNPSATDGAIKKTQEVNVAEDDSLRPLQYVSRVRKISRGSTSSERGSICSVSSVTAVLRERLGRSSSLKVRRHRAESETLQPGSPALATVRRPRRAVSLRLPRSHRRSHEQDTNLPTIYVEDSPRARNHNDRMMGRKSSLKRALSLLSMNSLRQDVAGHQKPQKPVQRILRQPRRRHNTVRGLSGMAIDAANQPVLQRSSTLYYPTAATLRHAYATRRACSDNQS